MFVGHYAPAAALAGGRIKLWHAFVAVQFLDLLWAPFILLGIEKARVIESFTQANHLDLYYMPWTHSLVMALAWSIGGGLVYAFLRKSAGLLGGLIIGILIFSHWATDYLMHVPDLALWPGGEKVGLGLWQYGSLSLGLEVGLLTIGMVIYLAKTRAHNMIGTMMPLLLVALLIGAQLYGHFGPVPANIETVAISGLTSYIIFIVLAAIVDRTRHASS